MSDIELSDFEIIREYSSLDERRVFAARLPGGESIRLTAFSAEISQRPEFRRALKTDRAMLSMLQHQSVVKFLGSGESNGALFFWTEETDLQPLSLHLASGRKFSSEDVIEIGWQTCSALQQAHNRGLSHGGLSVNTVLLSQNLQVSLIDFGVARWLKAAQANATPSGSSSALITVSALASRQEVENDLTDLAAILIQLLETSHDPAESTEPGRVSMKVLLERLLTRVTSSNPAQRPVSAREFQGRLGEILIGTDGDSMPLVDHRESPTTSKRSIIVELFEPQPSSEPQEGSQRESAGSAWRGQKLPIFAVIAILVILTLIAGFLW